MLLIRCPYCEEDRSELEFRSVGEAHIVRPDNIAEISDEAFAEYFFLRDNPKGLIYERWRHNPWLRPLLQCGPPHRLGQVRDDLQGR